MQMQIIRGKKVEKNYFYYNPFYKSGIMIKIPFQNNTLKFLNK